MNCDLCGHERSPSARYCTRCGHPLDARCPDCGFLTAPGARFCGGCRLQLATRLAETAGERRPITFLFCDLVDSTSLFERLDPEDVREVQNALRRLFGLLASVHDGYAAEYVGDGVVMYFGYPRAQEDDAERAIRCGLEISHQVGSVHRAMGLDSPLSVRTGIHTSHAALGPLSPDDDRQWAAYGIATSIAGRLQNEAPPGGVVVTDVTWSLAGRHFVGRSLGALSLKGLSQRIGGWRIEGEAPAREWVDLPHTPALFVGREHEREVLAELWDAAGAGETHFVLIHGEPGMGKSRLVRWWCDTVGPAGAEVVVARATSNARNTPFHPIVVLLERVFGMGCGDARDDRPVALARGLRELGIDDTVAAPFLAPIFGMSPDRRHQTVDLPPARRRARCIEILTDVLSRLFSNGPTLFVFEDLHWADESTVELLEHVVATSAPAGLVGLFTARLDFDAGRVSGSGSRLRIIDLAKLNHLESEAIARAVARGKALPGQVLHQILARSEGVPLFVEELTRSVTESGMLREWTASWEILDPQWKDLIPMTVQGPLTARIDRLGSARSTAQLAATIGREFDVALLCEVSEHDETTVRGDLRRMREIGLAWEVGKSDSSIFMFKHALLRDAAYELSPRATRQIYHSRIARALRDPSNRSTAGARNDLIALHLTKAGEYDDAIAYWEAAGHDSLLRTANLEASGHFRRAIECLNEVPVTPERNRREFGLQNLIAPVFFSIYGWASVEAEQACLRSRELAIELGSQDQLYPALWGLWSVNFLRGELGSALPAANAVHTMAEASGDPLLQVTGRHAISYTHLFRGDFESALADADAGLALFDLTQEKAIADAFQLSASVCLRQSRAQALWMLGNVVDADEEAGRMLQLARDLDHPSSLAAGLAFALQGGGVRHSYTGEMTRLRETACELRQLCQDEGFYMWYPVAEIYLGLIDHAVGEPDARNRIEEGLELLAQTRTHVTSVMMYVIVAEAMVDAGADDEALRLLDEAEIGAAEREEAFYAPEIWRVRGRLLARQGHPARAESAYSRALELAISQKARSLELRAALDLYDLLGSRDRDPVESAALTRIFEKVRRHSDRPEPARAREILARPPIQPAPGVSYVG